MARNLVRLDIDVSKASKKLFRLERKMRTEGVAGAQEIGELGKFYARSIAPYYSGATFRNITLRRGDDESESVIFARNPVAGDGHRRNIKNFNLIRWMHTSPRAKSHIRSGEPQFMYKTRDYLAKQAPLRMKTRFNKIIVEFNRT